MLLTDSFSSALSILASDPPLASQAIFDASQLLRVDSCQKQTLRQQTEKKNAFKQDVMTGAETNGVLRVRIPPSLLRAPQTS